MSYSYRNWDPDQVALLPTDPRDWLPGDHLAYQIRDVVALIDAKPFGRFRRDTRGACAFDPRMLLSVYLYAMTLDVLSSRGMARLCLEDLGARFLCGNSAPPRYRVLAKFRQEHDDRLAGLLARSVEICTAAGLVEVSDRFLDGTKIKANAGLRKNRTYESLCAEIDKIDANVRKMLDKVAEHDAEEDAEFGPDSDGMTAREKRSDRELASQRREHLAQAKAELERRAKLEREEHMGKPPGERTHHKAPTGQASGDDRINATDPDSRIMTTHEKGYIQAYNAQAVVEPANLVITHAFLTNQVNDYDQLEPALTAMMQQIDAARQTVSDIDGQAKDLTMRLAADAGYRSLKNLTLADQTRCIDVFIPSKRESRSAIFVARPTASEEETDTNDLNEAMDAKLATQEGHDFYANRKCCCEPTFAMIKGCPGTVRFRQFLRRGLDKCQKDWLMICAVHNLRRYIASKSVQRPAKTNSTPINVRIGLISMPMAL